MKTNKTKFLILGTLILIAAGATVYFFFIKDDKIDFGISMNNNNNNGNLQGVSLNNPPQSKGRSKLVQKKLKLTPVRENIIKNKEMFR